MFENIKILRKADYSAVYDGKQCINHGTRPVDHIFAHKVQDKMEAMGYIPIEKKGECTFSSPKD